MELNPLKQINPYTILAVMFLFTTTYFILRKIFFVPVIEMMERRSKKIEGAKARYAEAAVVRERAEKEVERILAEARMEAERITEEAGKEMAKMRGARIAEANAAANEVQDRGRQEVVSLKDLEQGKLREGLLVCVNRTLEKLEVPGDEKTIQYVVNRVLSARGAGD